MEVYSPAEELFNRRRRTAGLCCSARPSCSRCCSRRCRSPPPPHRLAAILAMMVVLWITEALPLAVTALIGPVLADRAARRAGADGVRAVRRSDHLPVHRQLHAGRGDVRPRPRPPHRLRRAVVAAGRRQPDADPHRLRRRDGGDLDVDQQHRHDGDDVPDRAVDRRAPDAGPRVGAAAAASSRPR